jgi:hypothetical protein
LSSEPAVALVAERAARVRQRSVRGIRFIKRRIGGGR